MRRGELAEDADFVSNIDRTNYWDGPETDEEGRITFEALIPGGMYRIPLYGKGKPVDFTAKSQQTVELGEIVVK